MNGGTCDCGLSAGCEYCNPNGSGFPLSVPNTRLEIRRADAINSLHDELIRLQSQADKDALYISQLEKCIEDARSCYPNKMANLSSILNDGWDIIKTKWKSYNSGS